MENTGLSDYHKAKFSGKKRNQSQTNLSAFCLMRSSDEGQKVQETIQIMPPDRAQKEKQDEEGHTHQGRKPVLIYLH